MGGAERIGDLPSQRQHLGHGERATRDPIRQGSAVHELGIRNRDEAVVQVFPRRRRWRRYSMAQRGETCASRWNRAMRSASPVAAGSDLTATSRPSLVSRAR
jgi:hypothetical protein